MTDEQEDLNKVLEEMAAQFETPVPTMEEAAKGIPVAESQYYNKKEIVGQVGSTDGDVLIGPIEELDHYRKILLWGPPGGGKTTFSATAPRPFFWDFEHGSSSVLNMPELRGKVTGAQIRRWAQVQTLMSLFSDGVHELAKKTDTLVVDTGSSAQARILDEQLSKRGPEAYLPMGGDYNENTQRMRRFMGFLRDLPMHLIVICHDVEEKPQNGVPYLRPDFTPKLLNSMIGMMDIVGYFYSREEQVENQTDPVTNRYMQIWPTQRIIAKSRVKLPKVLVNPTFDIILNAQKLEIGEAHTGK